MFLSGFSSQPKFSSGCILMSCFTENIAAQYSMLSAKYALKKCAALQRKRTKTFLFTKLVVLTVRHTM